MAGAGTDVTLGGAAIAAVSAGDAAGSTGAMNR
jgi:hypothetical protein